MTVAWYVAHTKSFSEQQVRCHMEARGIECFLPAVATSLSGRGRENIPLFPGYLFVRYDLQASNFGSLTWRSRLLNLVSFDGFTPSVPDEVILALQELIVNINLNGGLWTRFKPGDHVMVNLGSQESERIAEVVTGSKSPQGRVKVLLDFLGQKAHAMIPWQKIRLVSHDSTTMKTSEYLPLRRTRGRGRYIYGVSPRVKQNECLSM